MTTDDEQHELPAEIADLASNIGFDLALDAIGLGQIASLIDTLAALQDAVRADRKLSAMEKEDAEFLLENEITRLLTW